jgi:hypothetical protein
MSAFALLLGDKRTSSAPANFLIYVCEPDLAAALWNVAPPLCPSRHRAPIRSGFPIPLLTKVGLVRGQDTRFRRRPRFDSAPLAAPPAGPSSIDATAEAE